MNHIVGAELLWLARMTKGPAPLPVWPDLSLQDCEKHFNSLPEKLLDRLGMEPGAHAGRASYGRPHLAILCGCHRTYWRFAL